MEVFLGAERGSQLTLTNDITDHDQRYNRPTPIALTLARILVTRLARILVTRLARIRVTRLARILVTRAL